MNPITSAPASAKVSRLSRNAHTYRGAAAGVVTWLVAKYSTIDPFGEPGPAPDRARRTATCRAGGQGALSLDLTACHASVSESLLVLKDQDWPPVTGT